jgi:uncharacterized membrane protein YqjE
MPDESRLMHGQKNIKFSIVALSTVKVLLQLLMMMMMMMMMMTIMMIIIIIIIIIQQNKYNKKTKPI